MRSHRNTGLSKNLDIKSPSQLDDLRIEEPTNQYTIGCWLEALWMLSGHFRDDEATLRHLLPAQLACCELWVLHRRLQTYSSPTLQYIMLSIRNARNSWDDTRIVPWLIFGSIKGMVAVESNSRGIGQDAASRLRDVLKNVSHQRPVNII